MTLSAIISEEVSKTYTVCEVQLHALCTCRVVDRSSYVATADYVESCCHIFPLRRDCSRLAGSHSYGDGDDEGDGAGDGEDGDDGVSPMNSDKDKSCCSV